MFMTKGQIARLARDHRWDARRIKNPPPEYLQVQEQILRKLREVFGADSSEHTRHVVNAVEEIGTLSGARSTDGT